MVSRSYGILLFPLIALTLRAHPYPYKAANRKDVRVIRELKVALRNFLLQICNASTAQLTRRFIHSFSLHSTIMELRIYDRSGPYSSGEFDIHDEPEKFIPAVAGYAMLDEHLGLDTLPSWMTQAAISRI